MYFKNTAHTLFIVQNISCYVSTLPHWNSIFPHPALIPCFNWTIHHGGTTPSPNAVFSLTSFIPGHYRFPSLKHPPSRRPWPTRLRLGAVTSLPGMTFSPSGDLKFSSRFCVEPLDSSLRPPRPIIICLGLTGDHCLLSLGSS